MVKKIFQFIWEVRQEFSKVSWPTRDELLGSTYIVLILTAVLAVFIFSIDTILANVIRLLLS